eukprot:TRINITY_DN39135_c0_g1_i1.p2 TRINITY_DN39135_c0_g1~~TRINITY_DN39135_c0_g1_i1.p2  ORF type:complete len:100 (+),score=1.16 TRINITY_DN39135_c0_g1_i1:377-676(+)
MLTFYFLPCKSSLQPRSIMELKKAPRPPLWRSMVMDIQDEHPIQVAGELTLETPCSSAHKDLHFCTKCFLLSSDLLLLRKVHPQGRPLHMVLPSSKHTE